VYHINSGTGAVDTSTSYTMLDLVNAPFNVDNEYIEIKFTLSDKCEVDITKPFECFDLIDANKPLNLDGTHSPYTPSDERGCFYKIGSEPSKILYSAVPAT